MEKNREQRTSRVKKGNSEGIAIKEVCKKLKDFFSMTETESKLKAHDTKVDKRGWCSWQKMILSDWGNTYYCINVQLHRRSIKQLQLCNIRPEIVC